MSGSAVVLLISAVVVIGVGVLYVTNDLSWLEAWFRPFSGLSDQAEKIRLRTEQEIARAEKLKAILEAKKGLSEAKAENARLQKEIDAIGRADTTEARSATKVKRL